ncbi:MAG TPA: hypothetical protein VF533_01670, partial [Solirubrobacteraceae bacterium]
MRRSPSSARPWATLAAAAITAVLLLAAPGPASAATLTPTAPPTVSGVFREGGAANATPGTWPGAEVTVRYQWQRCDARGQLCTTITGRTLQSYTPQAADVGSTLRVEVDVISADGAGQAISAPTPVITGLPPANTSAPTIVGYPRSEQTLTADPRAWAGTQPIEFAYQWLACDERGQACAVLPGAAAQTYRLAAGDLGRRLQVRVTATNAAGQSVIHSGLTAPIGPPAPPVPARAPALSGTARDGDTLTADRGAWTGADPLTYAHRWLRCNALAPDACTPVTGQTAATYRLSGADLATVIRAEVTATNPDGAATQRSSPSAPVAPRPPAPAGAPTISGTPRAGKVLTGAKNQFDGTPVIEYAVAWRRCWETCSEIPGATASTYLLTEADAGATLVFAVTATNAAGSATKGSLPTRQIAPAAPPRSVTPPVLSGVATDGRTLSTSNGTWSGLSPRYSQQWLRCDAAGDACAAIAGATRATYALTPADVGGTIRSRVTATNEDGTADAQSAPTAPVAAIPPAPATPVLAGAAAEGEGLTATTGSWGGSPPVALAYAWERCAIDGTACEDVAGANEATYLLAPRDIGSRVRVRVTGSNAGGRVEARSALTARIEGTAPAPQDPGPAVRGVARDGIALTGDRGTWRGTAPLAFALLWQRCNPAGGACAAIAGATADTYTPGAADHGATIRLHVEAANAYGARSADSPATAVIAPAPPAEMAPPSVAGVREDGATLTASPGRWTGTAPLTFAFQWERADVLADGWSAIPGATAATYRLTSADVGATLRVRVTVTNAAATPGVGYSPPIDGIAAVAPAFTEPPAVTGAARDGQALSATTGTWTGTEPRRMDLQWLRCDAAGAACTAVDGAGSATYRLVRADIGHTLRLRVSVTNAATAEPVRAVSDRTPLVVPDPPASRVAPTVVGVPRDGRTLSADPGEWSGTTPIEHRYQWERCTTTVPVRCAPIDGASAATYQLRASEIGSSVRVQVTAANAGGSATAPSGTTATVAGDPPRNLELPTVTGTPYDGEVLTAAPGRWTGAVPFTYDYRWARCDPLTASCGTIPGALGTTYRVGSADLGYRIRLEVIARNAGGSTSALAARTVVASPRPPAFATPPSITGRPGVGQDLTAGDGTWTGTAPLTVTREWLRCDAAGAGCAPITGAGAPRYRLTAADLGHRIRLRVHVDNAARGLGVAARTAATKVVRDDPPRNLAAPRVSGEGGLAAVGVPLTATTGTWDGGPPMVPVFRWQRCDPQGAACAEIPGATSNRYVPGALDKGARLRISVAYDNGVGEGRAVSEPTAAITGAPPALSVPPAIAVRTDLRSGSELTAQPGLWTGAAPIVTTFQWLRCDAAGAACATIPGATASTRTLADADVGHALRVRVRAANETSAAVETSEPTGVVEALAPALVGTVTLRLDAARAQPGVRVHATWGTWAGTAPIDVTARWERCTAPSVCEAIPGATDADYTLAEADVGRRLRLVVGARNAGGTVSAASQLTDLVAGSVPAATRPPAVVVEPGSALRDGGVLRVDPGEWTGTGPLTTVYYWQRCGADASRCAPVAGASGATYALGPDDVGQRIAVLVSVRGPGGRTETASTPTEAIAAVGPAADGPPSIERPAGVLKIGSRLGVQPGAWTGTAPVALEYQWVRCDAAGEACRAVDAAVKPTLTLAARDFGDAGALAGTLRVIVTGRNRGGALSLRSEPVGQGPVPVAAKPAPAATPKPATPKPAATKPAT